jgi:hypothetical protein
MIAKPKYRYTLKIAVDCMKMLTKLRRISISRPENRIPPRNKKDLLSAQRALRVKLTNITHVPRRAVGMMLKTQTHTFSHKSKNVLNIHRTFTYPMNMVMLMTYSSLFSLHTLVNFFTIELFL